MAGQLRIIGREGDLGVGWDESKPDTVAAAHERFDGFLKRGGMAFKTGKENVQIRAFDPTAEEIILVPQIAGG